MLEIGTHVKVIKGRYIGYEGGVIGGDLDKNYITVNVWGIHSLRFEPYELEVVDG
jgi:transcription antitermination factor NusG